MKPINVYNYYFSTYCVEPRIKGIFGRHIDELG